MNAELADPFGERQTWWWRILLPLACALSCWLWSLIGLSQLQERRHQDLYALLAYCDSAGQIFWKPGGEHFAFLFLTLPGWCGVGAILIALFFGSFGMRRLGWPSFIAYWIFGLICIAGFAAFMGWLWIYAIGIFI